MTDLEADLYCVIAAKELRIRRLEALLRRAIPYIDTGDPITARELLAEFEAVLATSQHRKDAEDA